MPLPSWRQLYYGRGKRLKPDNPGFKSSWASVLTSLKSHSVTNKEIIMICALQASVRIKCNKVRTQTLVHSRC